jgi:hypothetical protein
VSAGYWNIYIEPFAGYSALFYYYQPDGVTPIDVTGSTALMTFVAGNNQPMLTVGTGTGEIVVTGPSGEFALTLSAMQTATLLVNGFYDMLVTPSAGPPYRLVEGAVVVNPPRTIP